MPLLATVIALHNRRRTEDDTEALDDSPDLGMVWAKNIVEILRQNNGTAQEILDLDTVTVDELPPELITRIRDMTADIINATWMLPRSRPEAEPEYKASAVA